MRRCSGFALSPLEPPTPVTIVSATVDDDGWITLRTSAPTTWSSGEILNLDVTEEYPTFADVGRIDQYITLSPDGLELQGKSFSLPQPNGIRWVTPPTNWTPVSGSWAPSMLRPLTPV